MAGQLDTHQKAQAYPGKNSVFRIRDSESISPTLETGLWALKLRNHVIVLTYEILLCEYFLRSSAHI